jgi:hypothetical protein
MKKLILIFLSIYIFTGCSGYKPSSYYIKKEISSNVFVKLNINISNLSSSVLVKDALNEMIVARFGSKLVSNKEDAQTIINISLSNVSLSALQYDKDGYVNIYRVSVKIKVSYKVDKTTRKISVSDYYDFAVDKNAIISDTKKEEAVKIASSKAMESILSKIAVQTFK